MKSSPYLITLFFITCFSCQSIDDIDTNESSTKEDVNVANKSIALPTPAKRFENNMEWAAYLAAQAIITNANAKAQFINTINNSGFVKNVELENLLGQSVLDPSFRNAFEEQYVYFSNLSGCLRCPGGTVNPTGMESADCSGFCEYLMILLEENCLEIFLPNGFTSLSTTISSTAHPLNLDLLNDAYIHTENGINLKTISNTNVLTFINPLVVRPFINDVNDCEYDEYSEINFSLFLQ